MRNWNEYFWDVVSPGQRQTQLIHVNQNKINSSHTSWVTQWVVGHNKIKKQQQNNSIVIGTKVQNKVSIQPSLSSVSKSSCWILSMCMESLLNQLHKKTALFCGCITESKDLPTSMKHQSCPGQKLQEKLSCPHHQLPVQAKIKQTGHIWQFLEFVCSGYFCVPSRRRIRFCPSVLWWDQSMSIG